MDYRTGPQLMPPYGSSTYPSNSNIYPKPEIYPSAQPVHAGGFVIIPSPGGAVSGRRTPLSAQPFDGAVKTPRTAAQWAARAREATAEFKRNGFPAPVAWVFVEGKDIPPNAIIGGDDRGRPLYVARSFYEGSMHPGKAGRHLRLGASIPYNGREVDVPSFEVLVEAFTPARWVYQGTSSPQFPLPSQLQPQLQSLDVPSSTGVEAATIQQFNDINLSGVQRPNTGTPVGTQRLSLIKTVIIVDDSMSMAGQPWNDAREALAGVAELAGHVDSEGLDIYFLNNSRFRLDIRDRQAMRSLFDLIMPGGITPTGQKLKEILDIYIPKLENRRPAQKPVNIVVITDGVPTDDPKEVIVQAALRLDMANVPARQLGIQFVQIGDDPGATEALNELDNGLASMNGLRDMVDTTTFNPNDPLFRTENLVKILLGAVDSAVDNPGVGISPSVPKVGGPAWGSNYEY